MVFSVNPTTYPSDACTISANGRKVVFAKVGRCVIDLDQAGSVHHLSAHRTLQTTIRPPGLASLAVVRPTPSVGSAVALTARGLDAQGNDLGDVTAITTFTASHASCSRNTCTWDTAGPSTIRADVFTTRGTQAVTPALGIRMVSGGQSVAAFPATVGSPIDAGIDAIGGSSGSYAFARTSGPLPKGVVLGADGRSADHRSTPGRTRSPWWSRTPPTAGSGPP